MPRVPPQLPVDLLKPWPAAKWDAGWLAMLLYSRVVGLRTFDIRQRRNPVDYSFFEPAGSSGDLAFGSDGAAAAEREDS